VLLASSRCCPLSSGPFSDLKIRMWGTAAIFTCFSCVAAKISACHLEWWGGAALACEGLVSDASLELTCKNFTATVMKKYKMAVRGKCDITSGPTSQQSSRIAQPFDRPLQHKLCPECLLPWRDKLQEDCAMPLRAIL
jgi:hypothetical protein